MTTEPRDAVIVDADGRSTPVDATDASARYEVLEEIGSGAMGVVHRARDRVLGRIVAIKFLKADTPAQAERFLREARAQGTIDHPNVCEVFDTGRIGSRLFIAMRYIDGPTLQAARTELTLPERVQVVKAVAEAAHEAHRRGLVHRDIKPANVLLHSGERGWHPYLTDFGLVADAQAATLTTVGAVVGTPEYMPPEMLTGDRAAVDRRSDVYSLGAMLYELLTGRPPYSGGSLVDVIMRVLTTEAAAPRSLQRDIPRDLELIVLKCLEKEKQRRYDSARELADDLQRYLDGEPVHAKPAALTHRLARGIRRHKAIAAISILALLAIAATAVVALQYGIRTRRQAEFARLFDQQRQYVTERLRYAYTRPLHDVRPEKTAALARTQRLLRETADRGDAASGPGHFAAGAMYLAVHDYDSARRELMAAWDQAGYQEPQVAYARALAMGALYEREANAAQRIASTEPRERRMREVDEQFRVPAAQMLQRSRGVEAESEALLHARIAYYERRYPAALAELASVYRDYPWLYEAHVLEASVRRRTADEEYRAGASARAIESLVAADHALVRAAQLAPSDPSVHDARCGVKVAMMRLRWQSSGQTVAPLLSEAVGACDQALVADRALASAWEQKAEAYVQMAVEVNSRAALDEERFGFLDRAIEAAKQAVAINPASEAAWNQLGQAWWWRAPRDFTRRSEFVTAVNECGTALSHAARLNPNSAPIRSSLANVHLLRRDFCVQEGCDPAPILRQAIAEYEAAIRIDPLFINPRNNVALAYMHLARHTGLHGGEFMSLIDRGVEQGLAAHRLNPEIFNPLDTLGELEVTRAELLLHAGRDPRAALAASRNWVEKGLKIKREHSTLLRTLYVAHLVDGGWAWSRGEDPTASLDAADAVSARAPGFQTRFNRWVALWRAVWAVRSGRGVRQAIAQARASTARIPAAERKAEDLCVEGATDLLESRLSGDERLRRVGKERLDRELALNPNLRPLFGSFLTLADPSAPLPRPTACVR